MIFKVGWWMYLSAFCLKPLSPIIVCWGRTLYTLIPRLTWNIHAHMRARARVQARFKKGQNRKIVHRG